MGLTAPKMETQEVCPGGSCHLIYLGVLAYTILKIVFSAFLSFLLITGWFKLVPTEGEMHTHTNREIQIKPTARHLTPIRIIIFPKPGHSKC